MMYMEQNSRNQFTAAMGPREAEQVVLRALMAAARKSAPCPTADELAALIPDGTISRTVDIVKRLERCGVIKVQRYQRGRQVTIVSTGQCTRPVIGGTPHWRERPRSVPSPTEHSVRAKKPDVFSEIVTAATREQRPVAEFLADLVWMGFDAYQAEGREL